MSSHAEEAVKMFVEGFNCAQSVLTCCAGDLPIDRKTALAVAGPFGGGMGNTGRTLRRGDRRDDGDRPETPPARSRR